MLRYSSVKLARSHSLSGTFGIFSFLTKFIVHNTFQTTFQGIEYQEFSSDTNNTRYPPFDTHSYNRRLYKLNPIEKPTIMSAESNSCILIDGRATAKAIRGELKCRVDELKEKYPNKAPGLAFVLVGDRSDSSMYVRMKKRACAEVGIETVGHELEAAVSEEELVKIVRKLNADDNVHGILVQLPLPSHISERRVLDEISAEKDVDGLHPLNFGRLALRGCEPGFVACTPLGCLELLKRYNIPMHGKTATVLGRSNIVGLPMAQLLQQQGATVTVCHTATPNTREIIAASDIVVAAIGKAEYVKGDWIKPGATIIDVGMNRIDDETTSKGYRLAGDVDFNAAQKHAGAITPVPGGVGPMTIAMLLNNTIIGAERTFKKISQSNE